MNSLAQAQISTVFTTPMTRRSAVRAFALGAAALAAGVASSANRASAGSVTQYKTTANLNFRSGPGTSYAVIRVIPAGSIVAHTGAVQNNFYEVGYGGTYGWVHKDYLAPVGSGDPVIVGEARTTANVNLRSGPSTGHQVLRVVAAGTWVKVSNTVQNGFRYVVHNGLAGWIADQYLYWPTDNPPSGETFTTTANLNLRAEPSTSAKVLLVMPEGSVVKALSGTAPGWRQVSYKGTVGWAATPYLN